MTPESMKRLCQLRQENDAFAGVMERHKARFDALKTRHEDGTSPRAVVAFNLFQTPPDIAAQMAALIVAGLPDGARILEPSAGLGRLYAALLPVMPEGGRVVMVENSPECCRELYRLTEKRDGDRLYQRDFLECMTGDLGGEFDAVCMNPPFKQGLDIKHVLHALAMLKAGGILVALCFNGARQNAYLKPRCNTWEVLPENSFQAEGTGASVALITIVKE